MSGRPDPAAQADCQEATAARLAYPHRLTDSADQTSPWRSSSPRSASSGARAPKARRDIGSSPPYPIPQLHRGGLPSGRCEPLLGEDAAHRYRAFARWRFARAPSWHCHPRRAFRRFAVRVWWSSTRRRASTTSGPRRSATAAKQDRRTKAPLGQPAPLHRGVREIKYDSVEALSPGIGPRTEYLVICRVGNGTGDRLENRENVQLQCVTWASRALRSLFGCVRPAARSD